MDQWYGSILVRAKHEWPFFSFYFPLFLQIQLYMSCIQKCLTTNTHFSLSAVCCLENCLNLNLVAWVLLCSLWSMAGPFLQDTAPGLTSFDLQALRPLFLPFSPCVSVEYSKVTRLFLTLVSVLSLGLILAVYTGSLFLPYSAQMLPFGKFVPAALASLLALIPSPYFISPTTGLILQMMKLPLSGKHCITPTGMSLHEHRFPVFLELQF